MQPVIVLSSHTIGLAVIRSLGKEGVPVYVAYYDKNDMGYVSKYVKKAFLVPDPETDETGFVEELIKVTKKVGPNVILPADDTTLLAVSRHKSLLSEYGFVSCPPWDVIQTLLDKKYTYMVAQDIGVPCPKTYALESEESLWAQKDNIEYPCLIKPCYSHKFYNVFNKKLFKVSSFSEAVQAFSRAHSADVEVMLQEFIPGNDELGVNYNSFFCDGRPVVEFTAQKVRLSPPGSGVPRVVVSKVIQDVMQSGRDIVKAIGFEGYSCTEFKRDPRDGQYKLMEVNGRHNRSSLLALKCGINFPWLEYHYNVTGELLPASQCEDEIFWIDEFKDIYEFVFNHKAERLSLSDFLYPYLKKNVYANFDTADWRPFKHRAANLFRRKIFDRTEGEEPRISSRKITGTNHNITPINPLTDNRWDKFVAQHPMGSIYHHSAWINLVATTFNYRPHCYALTEKTTDSLKGVLPLMAPRGISMKGRLVSVPFATYCDPLVPDERVGECLDLVLNSTPGFSSIELRTRSDPATYSAELGKDISYISHSVALSGGADAVYDKLHDSCVKRKIKKAQKSGLSLKLADCEDDIKRIYGLLLLMRRAKGLPPHPYKLFVNLWKTLAPPGMLYAPYVVYGDKVISAAIILKYGDTIYYEYAASDPSYMQLGPSQYLLWEVIKRGIAEGAKKLDLGRSHPDNHSLIQFKNRWGATATAITYCRYPMPTREKVTGNAMVTFGGMLNRHLPTSLLRLEGELVYRFLR